MTDDLIARTDAFVKERIASNGPGHDWSHTNRVRNMALQIAKTEGGDPLIIELGALLEDVDDHKAHQGDSTIGASVAREFLASQNVDQDIIDRVTHIVEFISFKRADAPNHISSLEGKIVQDADRLDAMGAMGIARTFSYGAKRDRPFYDPNGGETSIQHFYDKLLQLKDLMNTKTAKKIAEGRHRFLEQYVEEFLAEWNGER